MMYPAAMEREHEPAPEFLPAGTKVHCTDTDTGEIKTYTVVGVSDYVHDPDSYGDMIELSGEEGYYITKNIRQLRVVGEDPNK